jgi:DNA-binding NarL/FixJ family response regulator
MWADDPGRGGVVLLVDDAPETLRPLVEALEAASMSALVARDARAAMALLDRLRPDAILLDAVMPGMDGFALCRLLKSRAELATTPVLFATGLSATENIVEGLRAGGLDYLVKPIAPDEMIARLSIHIANARMMAASQAALDAAGAAIVAFRRDGAVAWSSPSARAILERPETRRAGEAIAAWAAHAADRAASDCAPLRRETPDGRMLTLTLVGRTGAAETLARLAITDDAPVATRLSKAFPISGREAEVLSWVAKGKTNRDIAAILGLSPRTVNKHLEQVLAKLGVENRTAAAAAALRALG